MNILLIFLCVTMCAISVAFVGGGLMAFVIEYYFRVKTDYISKLTGAVGKALETYGEKLRKGQ